MIEKGNNTSSVPLNATWSLNAKSSAPYKESTWKPIVTCKLILTHFRIVLAFSVKSWSLPLLGFCVLSHELRSIMQRRHCFFKVCPSALSHTTRVLTTKRPLFHQYNFGDCKRSLQVYKLYITACNLTLHI